MLMTSHKPVSPPQSVSDYHKTADSQTVKLHVLHPNTGNCCANRQRESLSFVLNDIIAAEPVYSSCIRAPKKIPTVLLSLKMKTQFAFETSSLGAVSDRERSRHHNICVFYHPTRQLGSPPETGRRPGSNFLYKSHPTP